MGFWNWPNTITIIRVILLFVLVYFLFLDSYILHVASLFLVILVFFMDYLDGWVAKRMGTTTKMGAVLDIAGDRIVENILWIYLGFLNLVPIWVPAVFLTRGLITDSIRSKAMERGMKPFDMMRSKLGKVIVSGRISRGLYAFMKVFSIAFVIANYTFGWSYQVIGNYLVYITVLYCIARGLPVIYDSKYLFE